MKKYSKKLLALMAMGLTAAQAQAAITAPVLDTGDPLIVAGAVLTGGAALWGIKKAIGLLR